MSEPPTTLSYEPRKHMRRRRARRVVTALLLLAVVIMTVIAVRRYGRAVQEHVLLLYRQHACLTYTAPEDRVVFTNDPKLTGPLLTAGAADLSKMWWSPPDPTGHRKPAVGYCAPEWENFTTFFLQAFQYGAVIFLHERIAPSGEQRMVVLKLYQPFSTKFDFVVDSVCLRPAPFWGGWPHAMGGGTTTPDDLFHQPTGNLVLYAGQPDAADESHFTIGYGVADQTGTIDDWLQNDGNVRLAVRDGPLKK